jgi:copper transport protein
VRSAVDGHVTNGSVPFGVGVPPDATSLIPAVDAPDPMLERPPWVESAVRWLNYLALAIALGGLPFGLLVWRPAVRAASAQGLDVSRADSSMTRLVRRLIVLGGLLSLIASLMFLLVQAANAAGVPLAEALGAPLARHLGSYSGKLVLARIGLIVLLGLAALRLPSLNQGAVRAWWAALGLGAAASLTFSLTSHAAAAGNAVAVVVDWLHVASMVCWLGGLIPLAYAIGSARRGPAQSIPLWLLVPRFSTLAVASVAVLVLSGLYSYSLHINRLDLLRATTYGRLLLVKSAVFGVLLALGAANLLILSPRLRRPAASSSSRLFARTVPAEVLAGALVLLMAGAMTAVAPSLAALQARDQMRASLVGEATINQVHLALWVAPSRPGHNEFAVDVQDNRPGVSAVPAEVLLRLTRAGEDDMGTLQVATQTSDGVRYAARGSYLSMEGDWEVEIILRRAGFDDVRLSLELSVAE